MFGLFTESNSLIYSEGFGLTIPFAGIRFNVPTNLWGAISALANIMSFLMLSNKLLPNRLFIFVIKIRFCDFSSHIFLGGASVAIFGYSGIILNLKLLLLK